MTRPSWDEYFLKIAMLVAERGTCHRHHVGAIVVKNKKILTTGYNGAAAGTDDCLKLGCLRNELGIASGTRQEICRAIHAEQNAIIQAGIHGLSIYGGTMYCTHTPCMICAKIISNAGIKRLVTYAEYPDQNALDLLQEVGIEFIKLPKPNPSIGTLD